MHVKIIICRFDTSSYLFVKWYEIEYSNLLYDLLTDLSFSSPL